MIDGWVDETCFVSVIAYHCLKKEGNSDIPYNMDEPWTYARELRQTQKDTFYIILLIWYI